jgi:class 3 adenylate cyclase
MRMKRKAKAVTITIDPTQPSLDWPALRQQRRAIVVVDVVESVRLMQANEADVVDRWRRFVNDVRTQVLPVHAGRLVKSLGDGLLLEFASTRPAVMAAFQIARAVEPYNIGREALAVNSMYTGQASTLRPDLHPLQVRVRSSYLPRRGTNSPTGMIAGSTILGSAS